MSIQKIIFMGTDIYAKTILNGLIECCDIEILSIYTQPDKPTGRKKILTSPPVAEFIKKSYNNIDLFQPIDLKKEINKIKLLKPDFIIVASYGQILSKDILDIAPCINLHASIYQNIEELVRLNRRF